MTKIRRQTECIDTFREVCLKGIVGEIIPVYAEISEKGQLEILHAYKNELMREISSKGQVDVAKWLYENIEDIDMGVNNNIIFIVACLNGHIPMVEWLLNEFPALYRRSLCDGFGNACLGNKLEM